MADFYTGIYNPDVLSCLANLSNDEVFTPPDVANKMLDLLPQELFSNPNTTFLDPACKSGVFLREIAKRLIEVSKNEELQLDDDAALLIARVSDGALRDALSILDQCAGYNEPITIKKIGRASCRERV